MLSVSGIWLHAYATHQFHGEETSNVVMAKPAAGQNRHQLLCRPASLWIFFYITNTIRMTHNLAEWLSLNITIYNRCVPHYYIDSPPRNVFTT